MLNTGHEEVNREWESVATIFYQDGATIKSEICRGTEDVCLTLARTIDHPDQEFVITKQQANEVIYVLSKALVRFTEVKEDEE